MLLRREQHARVTRVHRKREHPPAEIGDRLRRPGQSSEIGEQLFRPRECARLGRFEPAELRDLVDPARLQRQHHFGKIEPLHFRQLLRRTLAVLAFGPQSQAPAGRSASGASGTLICGSAADLLHQQRVDAAARIEARDARQAAIDHYAHAFDRERSLGDVGGDDRLALVVVRQRRVLLRRRQLTIERQRDKLAADARGAHRRKRAHDLILARHEDEHVAIRCARELVELIRRQVPDRVIVGADRLLQILNRNRMLPTRRGQQRRGCEKLLKRAGVERRRHHDDLEIRPRGFLQTQRTRQRDVTVEMPLVKLVEQDRSHAAQFRILDATAAAEYLR